jgi:hypothetical protein
VFDVFPLICYYVSIFLIGVYLSSEHRERVIAG